MYEFLEAIDNNPESELFETEQISATSDNNHLMKNNQSDNIMAEFMIMFKMNDNSAMIMSKFDDHFAKLDTVVSRTLSTASWCEYVRANVTVVKDCKQLIKLEHGEKRLNRKKTQNTKCN